MALVTTESKGTLAGKFIRAQQALRTYHNTLDDMKNIRQALFDFESVIKDMIKAIDNGAFEDIDAVAMVAILKLIEKK